MTDSETVTRRLLEARGRRLRYFRHPQLRTGPTLAYKAALDTLLAERGYRVAPVTVDTNDFVFADVYARALASEDRERLARVAEAYLPYMKDVFAQAFVVASVDARTGAADASGAA